MFAYCRALVSFAGLGITAKAQGLDQIVVTIPFEFAVAGKTLPASTYRVNRVSNDRWAGLIFVSFANRAGAIVHPIEVESAPADKAQVSFETAGGEHFLSKIQTAETYSPFQCHVRRFCWPRENHTPTLLQEVLSEPTR